MDIAERKILFFSSYLLLFGRKFGAGNFVKMPFLFFVLVIQGYFALNMLQNVVNSYNNVKFLILPLQCSAKGGEYIVMEGIAQST